MGPVNFGRVRVTLHASKENNEEPTQSEIYITTRISAVKGVDPDTEAIITELKNRQDAGETADEAFKSVLGKAKPDRALGYGRSVTMSYLKKDEEINKINKKHLEEVTSYKKKLQELKNKQELQDKELRKFHQIMNLLAQSNPDMNINEEEATCDGSNRQTPTTFPIDTIHAQAFRCQNAPNFSRSTHNLVFGKVNVGGGGRRSA